jgi:hypothetical protein
MNAKAVIELRAVLRTCDCSSLAALTLPLATLYRSFTEGFDTADLKDAKALLEELNNSPS